MSETIIRWALRMYFKSIFQYLFPIFLISFIIFMAIWDVEANNLEKHEDGLHQVALQLPWLNQFQFAGYYAAVEKGYYKDAGFQVSVIEGKPGLSPIDGVVSGRVNYGVARSEILLHRLHGKPIVVLATIMQHSALILLTKKESGISSPQDIIGHRVMMLKGDDAAEYIAMFHNEGVSLEQIKVIPSSYDINDLIEGKVDVFNAYSTNEPYYLEANNIPTTIIRPINYGIDFYGDSLFTSEQELKNNPDQVKAFRAASLRGWEYAMAHPEEIINVIQTKYGSKKTREHLSFEANSLRKLILPDLIEIGHMNPGRWLRMANTYVELGMAAPNYSLEGFIYDPNPRPDYTWMRWALGVAVFLGLFIGSSSILLLRHNKRLQVEVKLRKKAEEELRESEQELKLTLDATTDGIWSWNFETDMLHFSNKYYEMLGYAPKEFESTYENWVNLIHPEDRESALETAENYLKTKPDTYENEFRLKTKSGSYRWIRAKARVVKRGPGGNALYMIGNHEDITERKRTEEKLRESEQRFRSIFENISNIAVQGYDANRKIIFWNQVSEKLYGYKKEEAIGNQLEDLIVPPEMREFVIEAVRNWVENGIPIPHGELKLMRKDKTTFPVYSSHVILKNIRGEFEMYCVDIDMTERKRAKEALRRSNEELLKEHNQRVMLSKSLIELLEKDRRQIAMELHDHIGQTLTSLKMNLEMIHGKLEPEHKELGAQITVTQERTIQAIKDVKNVSHGLWPATIDALGVVSSLKELFNEIQQQTDMEIHCFSRGIPERFEEEKELAIYRIAQEALSNIIRHARAKNVFVNLVKKDEKISLSVEDDGVGFDQDKAMEPSKGKGPLGLLIMRERAVQLDGDFTIESQIGKGTHLLVEIPL